MFGFGKAKLRGALEASRAIGKVLGDRVTELTAEVAEKDERITRLDADCQRMAEKVRDLRADQARHMTAMAKQIRATEEAQRETRVVGKALNEILAERDALKAQLQPFLDLRARQAANLRAANERRRKPTQLAEVA